MAVGACSSVKSREAPNACATSAVVLAARACEGTLRIDREQ